MHKTLQKADDKIQQICDQLRLETLEPAREEAQRIVEEAQARAEEILAKAHQEAQGIQQEAREQLEQERNVFDSTLEQAGKMVLEKLKQSISKQLFREELFAEIESKTAARDVVARIINALVEALDKDGIDSDLIAAIPKTVSADELAEFLTKKTLKRLSKESIVLSDIQGGVQLKLADKRMTLDMTDKTLQELLKEYVGSAFRKRLFIES